MDLTMSSFSFTLKIFLDILYFNFMTYCNHLTTLLVCYTIFCARKQKKIFGRSVFFLLYPFLYPQPQSYHHT